MIRFSIRSLLLLATLVAIGLSVYPFSDLFISDWRHGNGKCQLHGCEMETVIVYRLSGSGPQMVPGYFAAKEKLFANCGIEYSPDLYGTERGKIYVCETCEKERQKWLKKQ